MCNSLLRIRDVFPGSGFSSIPDPGSEKVLSQIRDVCPGSRIRIFSIPDPGSASKNSISSTPKLFPSSRLHDSGLSSRIRMPYPDPDFLHIPDPGDKKATGSRMWILQQVLIRSVADPSPPYPHVFGPPGSGFYYHHAKIVRKTLIPTILWLFLTFYLWKMIYMYFQKAISRKNCVKKLFFCWHLEGQ